MHGRCLLLCTSVLNEHYVYFIIPAVELPPEPEPECAYTGQYRLAGNQTGVSIVDSFLSIPYIYGVLQICVNGTYYSVCTNSSYSNVNTLEIGSFVCGQLGYSTGEKMT